MTKNDNQFSCIYQDVCPKFKTSYCSNHCPYYTVMHGLKGNGGYWAGRNVPKQLDKVWANDLWDGYGFDKTRSYVSKMPQIVDSGKGIYMYSEQTPENPLGTGTGKTTSACAIINEYVKLKGKLIVQNKTEKVPSIALFVRLAELQNKFNAQFRGTVEQREQFSQSYYRFKSLLNVTKLLVLDDFATRSSTESFSNELFEILDHRLAHKLCTIFTSNLKREDLSKVYDQRIISRVYGLTVPLPFSGKDNRR